MTKPNLTDPITLRLPQEVLADIDVIAGMTERSRSWVIVRALRTYLMGEGGDILAYRKGQGEAEAGETEELDAVLADLERIAAEKVA